MTLERDLTSYVTYTLMLLCGISLILIGYIAVAPAPPNAGEQFTEFYILGENEKASDYPTHLAPGENTSVIVGIVNRESTDIKYRLVISWNETVSQRSQISLSRGSSWEEQIQFHAPQQPGTYKLQFDLYKTKPELANQPYRRLHLMVQVPQEDES